MKHEAQFLQSKSHIVWLEMYIPDVLNEEHSEMDIHVGLFVIAEAYQGQHSITFKLCLNFANMFMFVLDLMKLV